MTLIYSIWLKSNGLKVMKGMALITVVCKWGVVV